MLLRQGECDVLLSGGTDGCVLPGMIFGFSRMRAVSTHYNDRAGRGVAARSIAAATASCSAKAPGCWRSSCEDRARARGAPIYATIEGYASTCDAYHRVQMDPDGEQIVRCMQPRARHGRAAPPEEIGYVNYHGTSTQLNDAIESRCTRRAFGALADRVPGSSTKSMIGHPQGASGAAGVVATALALSRGFLPPTINLDRPRSGTATSTSFPTQGRAAQPEAALCNCLGFGSKNSALVLGRAAWTDVVDCRAADRPARWRRSSWRGPARACASSIARGSRAQAVRRHAESRRAGRAGAPRSTSRRCSRSSDADRRHADHRARAASRVRGRYRRRRRRPRHHARASSISGCSSQAVGAGAQVEEGVAVRGRARSPAARVDGVIGARRDGGDAGASRARMVDRGRRPAIGAGVRRAAWRGSRRSRGAGRSAPTSRTSTG